jgi:ADP-heptose:LPS heptosyltransferase
MGLGDEILVTGQARQLQERDPRPVYVVGKDAVPRWHWLWDGNPRFTKNKCGAQILVNGPGARPYVDYSEATPERWAYTDWRVTPGELYVPRIRKGDYVIIEPNIKRRASPNKDWGWDRWQELVRLMPDVRFMQLGPQGTRALDGVTFMRADNFQDALTLLSGARACVLHEGALHHTAAAFGIPAVVLFGGMLPLNTAYSAHVNLVVDAPEALGWRIPHPACAAAWDKIEPALVAEKLQGILYG